MTRETWMASPKRCVQRDRETEREADDPEYRGVRMGRGLRIPSPKEKERKIEREKGSPAKSTQLEIRGFHTD